MPGCSRRGSALCPPAGCTGGDGCPRSRGGLSDTWVSRRRRRLRTPTAPCKPPGRPSRLVRLLAAGNPPIRQPEGRRHQRRPARIVASRFSARIPQPTARVIVARAVVAQLLSALELTAAVRADPGSIARPRRRAAGGRIRSSGGSALAVPRRRRPLRSTLARWHAVSKYSSAVGTPLTWRWRTAKTEPS